MGGGAPAARDPVIISLGSVNVDFQVRTDRWPDAGETLLAHDFLMVAGGKAANVAYLARRLHGESVLVARVGDDLLADHALEPLSELGVDLRHVRRVAGEATGAALIDVRDDGEKAIMLAENANGAWSSDDEQDIEEALRGASEESVLVVDLEVSAGAVERAIAGARERGHVVVVDPSPAGRFTDDVAGAADFVTPNQVEAEQLTGVAVRSLPDGVRAGERLVERGVGAAMVKLGGDGCVLVSDGCRLHARPEPREVVDTTGAGDAFTGGLAVALAEGHTGPDALRYAVAAGALAVTAFGSQDAYPSREELERELGRVSVVAVPS